MIERVERERRIETENREREGGKDIEVERKREG